MLSTGLHLTSESTPSSMTPGSSSIVIVQFFDADMAFAEI